MATQYDLNINEHAITRGVRDKKMSRGSVSFQPRLSFRSFVSVTENMEGKKRIHATDLLVARTCYLMYNCTSNVKVF